jgi:hypothetical protein
MSPHHAAMKRLAAVSALAIGLLAPAAGQCVMCYRTAQAQQAARAHVLNAGIFILGVPPFLILGGFVALLFSRSERFRDEAPPEPGGERDPE